jgi:protein TonB
VIANVDEPVIPDKVSAERVTALPRPQGAFIISNRDYNPPPVGGGNGSGEGGRQIGEPSRVIIPDEPPPAPEPTPVVPKIVRRDVINGLATHLPKPAYPPLARQIQLQGAVNVQVLIDESGKVVSAKVVSGHPLLIGEAQRAALQAKFSPTTIGGQPVKISGVIVYNFVIQR